MAVSWYSVKTVYRSRCLGKASRTRDTVPSTVVEERVLIFRARNFAEAIKKAEKEATEYCKLVYANPMGQKVKTKYLGACDAFVLRDPPSNGAEVYSGMKAVDPGISDSRLVEDTFGNERAYQKTKRFFLNREFSGDTRK